MNPEMPNEAQNQTQSQPVVQPVSPSMEQPSNPRSFKKYIVGIIAIVVIIIIGLLAYFFLHKPDHYEFTINNTAVSETDFRDIYTYYKNIDFKTSDNKTILNLVKNLYIKNYIYKKTYLDNTSVSTLQNQVNAYSYPTSLANAPQSLRQLTAENNVMEQSLIKKVGVQIRSGDILTLQVSQSSSASAQQLEAFAQQTLRSYTELFNKGVPFNQIKIQFLNDKNIKAQPLLQPNANSFVQMPASHPFMPGNEFLDAVFNTPMNKASKVFKAASGNTVIFGIIHPTSPLIKGNYIDLQQWLNGQEKDVQVVTNFSDFQ